MGRTGWDCTHRHHVRGAPMANCTMNLVSRGLPEMNSLWMCYQERECWPSIEKSSVFQDKLEIQIFKIFTILRFLYVSWNFFQNSVGPNKTSLCSRCGPWVCNFCRNILSGVTQCTWLDFIDLIYGVSDFQICISSSVLQNITSHWT